jgi:hypothetical protein
VLKIPEPTATAAPIADGSLPNRPEPYGDSSAGIDEYRVSFQYDTNLVAGIQAQDAAVFLAWAVTAERCLPDL